MKTRSALASALIAAGCVQAQSNVIVPCVTSVDVASFHSPETLGLFLGKAIPQRASEACVRKVMAGRRMVIVVDHKEGDGRTTIVFREAHKTRVVTWLSVEDWQRQVNFDVKDGREVKRVII